MHEVLDKALQIAPDCRIAPLQKRVLALDPLHQASSQSLGKYLLQRDYYLANGLGASGLTVGPFLGNQLAKLALGEALDIDLALYDVGGAIK